MHIPEWVLPAWLVEALRAEALEMGVQFTRDPPALRVWADDETYDLDFDAPEETPDDVCLMVID